MTLFGKQSFVGVDLGSHDIKLVQVEAVKGGLALTRSIVLQTPHGAIKDGMVLDVPAVGAVIRDALKKGRISANTAVIAAAGGAVFVRPVIFPKVPEANLRKTIRFEASRYVPGTPDDCHIEFEILGSIDEDKMNVLIVAAPKDIVETRIAACEAGGLDVQIVDLEAFAMYRSLVETHPETKAADETIALVDIGAASTNVSVVHRGVFVVNRSVPNGGQLLTDALVNYFKIEIEDAETGKAQLDARELLDESTLKENPPLRVVQPHLDDLVREVRRSLNYFQSQQVEAGEQRAVERIVLAGGGSKLPGLADYMQRKLTLPVVSGGVFGNPLFQRFSEDNETGLELAVATGLAMRAPLARAA